MALMLRGGVSTAETEYGLTLLDEKSGEYWTLNPTGALVLRTLLEGGNDKQAAAALTELFGVDAETAANDVTDLVHGLRSASLVEST
jgi:Coenzyme PQQ synthesis protein D (PqqD)